LHWAQKPINTDIDTPWELQGGVRHLQKIHQKSTNEDHEWAATNNSSVERRFGVHLDWLIEL
jgi:hypothetical protein